MAKPKPLESSKNRLSVALATFNEDKCLADCLKSVRDLADEIVVVDGSSTDKTVEIAKSFGARVIVTSNKPIFHLNKQEAIDKCRGDWILQLDADEMVTPELAKEIREIVESANQEKLAAAYWIKRKKMFLGHWIKKGGQYPDLVIRLFKKGKAYLPCQSVHEQMQVKGEVGWLENPMIHLPTPSFSVYITKDNRYSTLSANELYQEKISLGVGSFLKYIVWKPLQTFLSLFLRHAGFLDGFPGFVFALYSGLHHTAAYVKYWEMRKTQENRTTKDWV